MILTMFEEHFRIVTTDTDRPVLSVPLTSLLQDDIMKEVLHTSSSLVKGIGLELAVSLVGLSFFGLAATKQIIMSQHNRILDLSLDNVTLQLQPYGDYAQVFFKLTEVKWTDLPADGRDTAVAKEWSRYFSATLNPLIEATAAAAGVKPSLIWNQFGSRMIHLMEFLRQTFPDGPIREVIESDYTLLISLPGGTFNYKKNPYEHTPCYLDSPYEPGRQIIVKSACCMYYKRENGTKCYTCPILKENERAEKKRQIEAARNEQTA